MLLAASLAGLAGDAGCSSRPASDVVAARRQSIVDGVPAPELSGVVQVGHAQGQHRCSGTLIASGLVLTAKHCTFRSAPDGDQPLPADGFQIGFGPDGARSERRSAVALSWIGMPDELAIDPAVAAGEDVALLELDEPAPPGATPLAVDLAFSPVDQQPVALAGFGITDPATGTNGTRTLGSGAITGFERATGIVQVAGDSSCFGDSGGPVLSEDLARVVGVLGQVGDSGDGGICDLGLSFAATAANLRVRRLIAKACAQLGGCGSGMRSDAGTAPPRMDGSAGSAIDAGDDPPRDADMPDAGGTSRVDRDPPARDAASAAPPGDDDDGGGCTLTPGRRRGLWPMLWLWAAAVLKRRRQPRNAARRARGRWRI